MAVAAAVAVAEAVAAVMVAAALRSFGVCALQWVRCFSDALQIVTPVAAQLAGAALAVERLPAQPLVLWLQGFQAWGHLVAVMVPVAEHLLASVWLPWARQGASCWLSALTGVPGPPLSGSTLGMQQRGRSAHTLSARHAAASGWY